MMKQLLICSMVLVLASCAGTKKKTSTSDENNIDTVANDGISLQLNGDSDSGKAGGLKTIYFDYSSSQLTKDSQNDLDKNAEILNANSAVLVQVEGHTDERGSVQFNLSLGEKRAKTIKDYLLGKGISSSRISIISIGKERPVEYGHDESSWSKNRRANFVITGK